jgi:hypothetical protein
MSQLHKKLLRKVNKERVQTLFVFSGKNLGSQDISFGITIGPRNFNKKIRIIPYEFKRPYSVD